MVPILGTCDLAEYTPKGYSDKPDSADGGILASLAAIAVLRLGRGGGLMVEPRTGGSEGICPASPCRSRVKPGG